MWYEFFRFEIIYRLKRPETYAFFLLLFLFALFGVEFVFQGIDLGLVRKNAPLVIAKTMGAITGLSMIAVSMIMGVPVLRDFQYDTTSLIYVNPISKKDYLLGHFLGSFVVLLFIFSGMLWGMMLGVYLPWTDPAAFLPFQFAHYLQPFLWVVLPTLFFGSSVFYVTGALSKKLMVVYTQGVIIFVLFMLTKGITNETWQALLDPFSLTTLSKASEAWSVAERNTLLIPVSGVMLLNKSLWVVLGLVALAIGYCKFRLIVVNENGLDKKRPKKVDPTVDRFAGALPTVKPVYHLRARFAQLFLNAWFHSCSILKLTSFWAILLCCFLIILINSVSLGSAYGVDSYPTTYLIIEELQEMSLYFFIILVVFYSGEIMWKEKEANFNLIHDATPLSSFINVGSRFLGLLIIYVIVLLSLILAGLLFQTFHGYFRYEPQVYFSGFFLELFPFLALYTMASLFFQAFTGRKFLGMLVTIAFAVINAAISLLGVDHPLVNFAGQALAGYSDMNGYGHFLKPYLWVKVYWLLFGVLLLILAGSLMVKGQASGLKNRWQKGLHESGKPQAVFSGVCLLLFLGVGGYIFYNTNVLNEFWTRQHQALFRADYEKSLKQFAYIPQPKIVAVKLKVDLFPSKRSYDISGNYVVVNTSAVPIGEIHLQKRIASKVELKDVVFDRRVTINQAYHKFHYSIYELDHALAPGDSMNMSFRQSYQPVGFEANGSDTDVVNNGTFFDNSVLPGFGYQRKYELEDEAARKDYDLTPRQGKADRDDVKELVNARSGSDSDGIVLDILISTEAPQTALTSGDLLATWSKNDRDYFHYKTTQRIINFYPFVSANYAVLKDSCSPAGNAPDETVALEIYYQQGHEYNLDRMLEAMKLSLDYYSTHFSPYQYKQLRIVEFPRYRTFAQSLPNIIPFSEAIGFVMNIKQEKDVDMAFYITAHEVAHQWWGLQLEAANVQGQNMILETLAQYAAMMVLKEKYPDEKLQQFLKLQLEDYREGGLRSKKEEPPLALVEDQSYIYYNKGAWNMYQLQQYIGENRINLALRNFLDDWRSFHNPQKPARYATTRDLIPYFREVTPDSAQYLITDLFARVNPVQ